MYIGLKLPQPWTPTDKPFPFLVYGAASAVGAFAIQLAQRSNLHPIIAIAGNGAKYVETLIDRSKGDTIVDYRNGNEALVQGIKDALNGQKLHYAYDAISEHGSYDNVSKVLEPDGHMALVLPGVAEKVKPETIDTYSVFVGKVHTDVRDFGYVVFRAFSYGLQQGWFKGHPYEVVKGGLNGVQEGLNNLKSGKASAVKYVFRIAETPGVES